MKLKITMLAVLGSLLTTPALAQQALYKIDPEHISVGFLVMHIGYAKVLGMFRKAGGEFYFDEKTEQLSKVKIVIDTDSVYSNHKRRDDHLRSPDFLGTASFPEMVFSADEAQRTGNRNYKVAGMLNLLGQSKPVTLNFTWNKSAQYPIGKKPYVMGVSGRGSFKRSDFGMQYAVKNGWVGDEVELIIEFEAQKQ